MMRQRKTRISESLYQMPCTELGNILIVPRVNGKRRQTMTNAELRELVHLLMMCGIMDKTATESGNVTNEEWLRMKNLIDKYQAEKEVPEVKGDLISRSELIQHTYSAVIDGVETDIIDVSDVDNAPTVENITIFAELGEDMADITREIMPQLLAKVRLQGKWISKEEALKIMCEKCPVYNCVSGCNSYRSIEKMLEEIIGGGADMRSGEEE